ncbi:hypothetical protein MJC1_04025 [Methylocystis sp. MJC1]|jgi:hypothetical protein|nr:hypothetical protein MJC1_04025 [Methylocystis sp. MJC1]
MPSFGQIRQNVEKQRCETDLKRAGYFAGLWNASLEIFETRAPSGRFEQVQWVRALGKIATGFDGPRSEMEARARHDFRALCRLNMAALHARLPEAAVGLRQMAQATALLAPDRVSAHLIAGQIARSLGPRKSA